MKAFNKFFGRIVFFAVLFATVGCDKVESVNYNDEESYSTTVVGSEDFICQITPLVSSLKTRSGEISEAEARAIITPLFPVADKYLSQNGYNYRKDFKQGDPRIILLALSLYDYERINKSVHRKTRASVSVVEIASCVLIGSEINSLITTGAEKAAVKHVLKKLASATLKKAIPYVGAALAITSAVSCLVEASKD